MYDQFKRELGQHAVVVLAFVYKKFEPYQTVSEQLYRSVIQNELRRASFRNFDGLEISVKTRLMHSGGGNTLSAPETLDIFKTNRVPLAPELRNPLVKKFINMEDGRVRIEELLDFIDYMKYPTEVPHGVAKEILMVKPEVVYIKVGELVEFMRSFQPAY
ncbi:uncharacterized protein LOC126841443 [Adelges cooleyi]|uniref:uncharacterized protein LOC126841443 n=1 Tax=Adelges cooleyi TaxID=133065 RepID=UPI00217FF3A1|nr:uncharacterized protein LOC126841443 [Adelges cooleyi]